MICFIFSGYCYFLDYGAFFPVTHIFKMMFFVPHSCRIYSVVDKQHRFKSGNIPRT